jgi:hypothetical protein
MKKAILSMPCGRRLEGDRLATLEGDTLSVPCEWSVSKKASHVDSPSLGNGQHRLSTGMDYGHTMYLPRGPKVVAYSADCVES